MTAATPEQQQQLLRLQQTDIEIRQLEHRRAHLPEQQQLDEVDGTLSDVTRELARARAELEDVERRQKRLDDDIAAVESRRKSEEARMYSGEVSSEKELEARKAELASLKRRKSDLEDELLEAMERREELESLDAELEQRQAELQAEVAEHTLARDEAAKGIDEELAAARERRDGQVDVLPPELVEVYEAARARHGGIAVAVLEHDTCSGCRLQLTAVELERVRAEAKKGLATCEECERFLVPR